MKHQLCYRLLLYSSRAFFIVIVFVTWAPWIVDLSDSSYETLLRPVALQEGTDFNVFWHWTLLSKLLHTTTASGVAEILHGAFYLSSLNVYPRAILWFAVKIYMHLPISVGAAWRADTVLFLFWVFLLGMLTVLTRVFSVFCVLSACVSSMCNANTSDSSFRHWLSARKWQLQLTVARNYLQMAHMVQTVLMAPLFGSGQWRADDQ